MSCGRSISPCCRQERPTSPCCSRPKPSPCCRMEQRPSSPCCNPRPTSPCCRPEIRSRPSSPCCRAERPSSPCCRPERPSSPCCRSERPSSPCYRPERPSSPCCRPERPSSPCCRSERPSSPCCSRPKPSPCCSKPRPSPCCGGGDGSAGCKLAAELLIFVKKAFLSQLPSCSRSQYECVGWNPILCTSAFQKFLEKQRACHYSNLIREVSRIPVPCESERHGCLEDLLCVIQSFENKGHIRKLECMGYKEVACFLKDRSVFYHSFAAKRLLKLSSKLLKFLRCSMRLSSCDHWSSVVCEDDCLRGCLNQIKIFLGTCDNVQSFAKRLDKLELCLIEFGPHSGGKGHGSLDARTLSGKIRRLLESPLGSELSKFYTVTYLDTAVSLLQNSCSIFEVLREYGYSR